jgi:hypothetical protein
LIKTKAIIEWSDARITNNKFLLNGNEIVPEFLNSPSISIASWNASFNSIQIKNILKFNRGGQTNQIKSSEERSLSNEGKMQTVKVTY